ncbi:hypothetical protein HYV43_00140 [Candidatus Micrarchaeota archaeon]|nr:hypothetical protein [Candidatus Micrarchaeota archaeon]
MDVNARHVTLAGLAAGLLCLVLALVAANVWLAAFSVLFLFLTLVVQRFGGVLLPFVLKGVRVVETRGGWQLDRDVVVAQDGERFVASAFLEADVHFSPSCHPHDASVSYGGAFEKALCGLAFPAQFGLLVYPVDLEKYREGVLTMRLEAELAMNRIRQSPKPDAVALAAQERKRIMCGRLLQQLSAGQRPLDAAYFVSTAAEGTSFEQAAEKARWQARELRAVLAHALNVSVRPMEGDDLRRCVDWKAAIPRGLGADD